MKPDARRRSRPGRRWGLRILFLLGGVAGLVTGMAAGSLPRGAHGWKPLRASNGEIRWVTTSRSDLLAPPMAPGWVRRLTGWGIPWPNDLPLEPLPASFGSSGGAAAAWFLVRTQRLEKELWHVDKESLRLADRNGRLLVWHGGSSCVRADGDGRKQMLCLRLPPELDSGDGSTLAFRLARFDGSRTDVVTFRFP